MESVVFSPGLEVLALAILMDILIGEPPGTIHPVVWIGKVIKYLNNLSFGNKRMFGIFMVIVTAGISLLAGAVVVIASSYISETFALLLAAYFLKSTFSFRMLLTSARHIKSQLESGTLKNAKKDLKALVSRDTTNLDKLHMTSAVIESTSENFVDGIVSPLFFYLILGLPGALVYKAVNTLDSMIGYRNKEFIELGWASARLDDILNWIPARLSLIFIFAASIFTGSPINAIKTCIRDRDQTASPNSGWPMAATAGSLGVRLEKKGHYILGGEFREPVPEDIERGSKLVGIATIFLFASIFAGVYVIRILIW
ncbi:MAG: cobalamin biosynthesis protein [Methanosarcinales archaeon]|nr:cobalamin biosynthesis protein [Methanosarcinales archaeon]